MNFNVTIKIILLIASGLSGTVFAPCHNLDTTSVLQDFLNRWLAEDNGTTLREFSILSERWLDSKFLGTNPCITFTIKRDMDIEGEIKPEEKR